MANMKRILSLALALILSISLISPAAAAETAAAIQLTKTSGTVTVSKSNGKDISMRTGMRLYNGYNVTTAAESYAWISLDSTKLVKLDASSSVDIRKNGAKLEVNVKYGSVFFDVSQKLNNNESLNVSSSTMTVGIRGTSGWVDATDQWVTETCLLEGTAQCVVADPVSGQAKSTQISGGDTAQCVVHTQDHAGDKCDILMERQGTDGIPGYILTELVQNVELCDKILHDSGLDILADLAKMAGGDPSGRTPDGKSASLEVLQEAERCQRQEEEETSRKQEEIDTRRDQQENNISQDNVWDQGQQSNQPFVPFIPSIPFETPNTPETPNPSETPTPSSPPDPPSTYTITFDANGGTVPMVSAATGTDGRLTSLPTPVREGYTFDGWFNAAQGGTQVLETQVFTAGTTIYAHWTALPPDACTVTFNSQDGSAETAVQVERGSAVTRPGDPIRTGYIFGGWYKEAACENEWDFIIDTVTGNVTLYAKWTLNQYTVTFDSQGGTAVESVQAAPGSTVTKPGDPTRTGYTFGGWYKEAVCTNEWDFDSDTLTGNVTLYARWVPVYTVTFNLNGGTSSAPVSAVIQPDGTIEFPSDPTNSGFSPHNSNPYSFDGWYTQQTGGSKVTGTSTFTQNTTLYAHWTVVDGWDWDLSENTLRIYGTGNMGEYTSADAPWGTSITNAVIEDGVTSIGEQAFRECTSLTSITIPTSVTNIGGNAFLGCSDLASITFASGSKLTSIGDGAFSSCSKLTRVTIPDGVRSIGGMSFSDCGALTSVTIPAGVDSIGNAAFYNCSKLTSIEIPEGVTIINDSAFFGCSSLASATIPTSVTNIAYGAFESCTSLTSVTYNGTKDQWTALQSSISGNNDPLTNATIYCTDGPIAPSTP